MAEWGDNERKEIGSLLSPSITNANYQSTESDGSSVSSSSSPQDGSCNYPREMVLNNQADVLSERLLACGNNDVMERIVLSNSFSLLHGQEDVLMQELNRDEGFTYRKSHRKSKQRKIDGYDKTMIQRVIAMFSLAMLGLIIIVVLLQIGTLIVGPPSQPIGAYNLVEIQVRMLFLFDCNLNKFLPK